MKTLLLRKDEVSGLIRMPEAIEAVEEAYRAFVRGQVERAETGT